MRDRKYLPIGNFFIKDDFSSFMLYYDHFRIQGYILNKYFRNSTLRKIKSYLLRNIAILIYISGLYSLIHKPIYLQDNAVIIFKGQGTLGSMVRVINSDGKFTVIKKVHNQDIYNNEKRFYETYKNNNSAIKLPVHRFLENTTIEIDLIAAKSFQRLIVEGSLAFKDSLQHLTRLRSELYTFYKTTPALIHGDLWLTNVFIDENKNYYLIDFSDSFSFDPLYDLYVLTYSILSTFQYIKLNEKTIKNYKLSNISVEDFLKTSKESLQKIESGFIKYREKRFPGMLYK